MTRTFQLNDAVRTNVPILVGLMGPSGGGKTFSALRLATGMVKVTGGDIHVIDTEARRALHYADKFKFKHMVFNAPFCPLDYMAAIEQCVKAGAGAVIVDSMSHEHEGPGGVLEQHDKECQRLKEAWNARSMEAVNFPAWAEPKARRRRLINTVVQLGVNAIFCFRAKEKSKPFKRGEIVDGKEMEKPGLMELGWMPIAGEEFVYEMATNLLLEPGSDGRPTVSSEDVGTRRLIKVPGQFRSVITGEHPLSEEIGAALASWGRGVPKEEKPKGNLVVAVGVLSTMTIEERKEYAHKLAEYSWTPQDRKALADAMKAPVVKPAEPEMREIGQEG